MRCNFELKTITIIFVALKVDILACVTCCRVIHIPSVHVCNIVKPFFCIFEMPCHCRTWHIECAHVFSVCINRKIRNHIIELAILTLNEIIVRGAKKEWWGKRGNIRLLAIHNGNGLDGSHIVIGVESSPI